MAMNRLLPMLAVAVIVGAGAGGRAQSQGAPPPAPQAGAAPPADAGAQQQPAQPEPGTPVFRGGINFVRVDVIVTDKKGNPVPNLSMEDFEVTEDGKPQTIETFKRIELDGGLMPASDGPPRAIRTDSDEETEAARDDVRLFGIFLDDYHVRLNASMAARESLRKFVESQLGPSDMVALMHPLDPTASVRFTRNHSAVMRGLQQFTGRKFDYTPRNEFEEKYAYYPAEVVERIRNQVSLSAIEGLIYRMGGLKEGRKALILVSEGYTNMLPPQMRDPVAALPGLGNPQRSDPDAGSGSILEDRAAFLASTDMQQDLRELYTAANRNNVAIYAVDPRGLATGEFDINENVGMRTDRAYLNSTMDTLRTLAEESDGRAIVNRNDITVAMKQIVRDTSAYYLLGYSSAAAPTDGKFHEIRVRTRRPGIQVRARKGYWALTAAETAKALAPPKPEAPKAVSAALSAIAPPSRSSLIRTWIGSERAESGKTRVTLVWEPMPKTSGAAARVEAPARVSVMAIAPDGTPYFRGRVPDASPGAGGAAAGARVTFEAAPGPVQLRLSVEGAASQVLDSETRDITVPDLTAPNAIGTPEVFRARTARELQLLKSDPKALPSAAREFNRAERLFIRVPVYGVQGTPPVVTARLLNKTAQPMSDLPVTPGEGTAAPSIEVPLAGLAQGEYLIEFKAAAGGSETTELLGIRVVG